MGAWGYKPAENDVAQEWLLHSYHGPISTVIESALDKALSNIEDDMVKLEAEVAIALLLDLSEAAGRFKFVTVEADFSSLFDKAHAACRTLLQQDEWLGSWNRPDDKSFVIRELLARLEFEERGRLR